MSPDLCTPIFTAVLFAVARTRKQPRCPSTNKWIRKLWYIYTMEYPVQFSRSFMADSATQWTAACQASLSITNSQSLLKLMPIVLVMPSDHFILCHPLLLPPSIFRSIRVFLDESVVRISWPNIRAQPQHQYFQRIFKTDFL